MQNGTATLGNSLQSLIKLKIWLSSSIPLYLSKGKENLSLHKNLYMDIYSDFIHYCQELEIIQMSFNWWTDKRGYINTMENYSSIERNELSIHPTTWISDAYGKWKKPIQKAINIVLLFCLYDMLEQAKLCDRKQIWGCREQGRGRSWRPKSTMCEVTICICWKCRVKVKMHRKNFQMKLSF